MGLRINRRFTVAKGISVGVGKRGMSVSKRGKHGSVGGNSRGGRTGSVRLLRGVSWMFGKRR